jgi:hypothetical protein
MQLTHSTKKANKPRNIRDSLAAATCTLLAGTSQAAGLPLADGSWEINGGLLYYSETDRVRAIEPVLGVRKEIDDTEFVSVRMVADSLTGASPNGAAPSDVAQTFTSPSGEETYTTQANETPLDPTFKDLRTALNVEWDKPLTQRLRGVFGFNYSTEHDYTSLGISASLAQDFNQRNTTLTLATSLSNDSLDPEGGVPVGFSTMPASGDKTITGSNETKDNRELLLGVTQVISRSTLMQVNYSYGQSSGYLSDPYKILSVLENDGSGDLRTTDRPYVFENRPDKRTYQSLYWKGVHQLANEDVITVSYRYFWDDWDIASHTVDARYRFELGGGHYLQPHLRYYQQSAADFYRQTLTDGEESTLQYASADYRLGELTTQTLGLKYGREFDNGAEWNIRAELMQQSGKTRSEDAVGKLQNQDLFPDMDAYIVNAGFTVSTDAIFKWFRRK